MSEEEKEMTVEDAIAVLADQPTISERLDKLEKLMEQILMRLPLSTGYTQTSPYVVTTSPQIVWTNGTTAASNTTITIDPNQMMNVKTF